MEKDQSSPLLSPRTKELNNNNNNNNNDRLKRDEWSEGAVSTLLEAYEGKWVLRNRAKLKGQDWEDVAKQVSGRSNNTKSAKTQTQCKNKIESMKKRYRSESVAADAAASSWPLYSRLDLLLRGNPNPAPPVMQKRNSDDDRVVKGDGNNNINICGKSSMEKNNNPIRMEESDSSTPAPAAAAAVYTTKSTKGGETFRKNKVTLTMKRKAREEDENEMMNWEEESCSSVIRWVAEVVVKSEQARMETMREIERMRAEAEAKRGELDLKRTQIIANTQLEIAKLLITNRGPDASFKIGTS
ncbi:hypothetical protein ACJIZ3_016010 [Penstemon smallii]|uniref:Myb/SANT-like DNA-binding domain-containing protein n=1 Tax=Penstemon smallii TaxID=265156 RepID=A0ABD3RP52_9LAMI